MYFAGSSLVLLLATHALAAVPAALHQNKARQATPYAVKEPPLTTPWTDKAGTDPWPEYPRPQLERSEWKNLNGIWQYQDAQSLAALDSPPFGQPLAHEVLVPSCLESGLSGKLCQSAWVIAHTHQHTSRYPREKYLIFVVYHAVHCSPVLQRPERSSELCRVTVTANTATTSGSPVEVKVYDGDEEVGSGQGTSDQTFDFVVDGVELWSPDSPKLYNVTVTMGDEEVHSYVGFRTIAKGKVDGVVRPLLNGEFIFMFGTLDQGYWPDGLYTPPTREAMIKVEPALFYRACDELGLLVIQDMPSARPLSRPDPCATSDIIPNASQQEEFSRQLEVLVNQFKSYPSIIAWGWGQITSYYPEFELTDRVKELDPSRLVDSTSGWIDHGAGDFSVSEGDHTRSRYDS
ncbi:unnamed protein product [Aspergillus oryzae var. brunneus]|uniref:Unnamed protein product n=1 Tax=Aspergillus oryzae var. brunneus TaxID=332754 RepID=A0ABQ6KH05_ASPOZ|nr:unnamed protein product [Aspergillus oryzae var. brunneus]